MGVTRQAVSEKMPAGGAKNEKKAEKTGGNHKRAAVGFYGTRALVPQTRASV